MTPPIEDQESGADVVAVSVDAEGVVETTRDDDSAQRTPEQDDLRDRLRARGYCAQVLFRRKRRLWPIPRI